MAVPKKRTSKAKSKSRKANWKRKASCAGQKAISMGKSVLSGKATSFVYLNSADKTEDFE
jgi:large subunit ribosomal protein L32